MEFTNFTTTLGLNNFEDMCFRRMSKNQNKILQTIFFPKQNQGFFFPIKKSLNYFRILFIWEENIKLTFVIKSHYHTEPVCDIVYQINVREKA